MANEKYIRPKLEASSSILSYLQKTFVNEKLNNWLGYFLISCVAAGFGYLVATDFIAGIGIFGIILGLSVILVCVMSAEWGLYINLVYCFLASHVSRVLFDGEMPIGIVTDVLVASTFLGLFVGNYNLRENTTAFFKSRPIVYYSIVFVYLCLQLLNPLSHSFLGWFIIIRKVFESFLFVFIAFNVFTNYARIWRFLRVLFCCALAAGLYGCIQQWHGLFSFEEYWVQSNPVRLNLIYLFGNYRKFSFFSGPTEFGVLMAGCSLLFLLIGINEKKALNKFILIAGVAIMLLGMSYSGTRTANAMVVGGIGLFILLTINKKSTKIFAFFAVMAFLFIMYAPIYSSATLIRFRTSFSAKEDASYNVRERNREGIQPYIYKHPFGGGLGTTGENGQKYNSGHALAGFPTDSSYLNKSLETGWVGMILTCILYFVILQYIVRGYFKVHSNRIKILFAALGAFFFSFYVGEIAQEAVGQFSNMVVYFPLLAIVVRLGYLKIGRPHDVD